MSSCLGASRPTMRLRLSRILTSACTAAGSPSKALRWTTSRSSSSRCRSLKKMRTRSSFVSSRASCIVTRLLRLATAILPLKLASQLVRIVRRRWRVATRSIIQLSAAPAHPVPVPFVKDAAAAIALGTPEFRPYGPELFVLDLDHEVAVDADLVDPGLDRQFETIAGPALDSTAGVERAA